MNDQNIIDNSGGGKGPYEELDDWSSNMEQPPLNDEVVDEVDPQYGGNKKGQEIKSISSQISLGDILRIKSPRQKDYHNLLFFVSYIDESVMHLVETVIIIFI